MTRPACANGSATGLSSFLYQGKVADQLVEGGFLLLLVPQPKQRGGMKGREHERRVRTLHELAAHGRNAEIGAQESARRGGAQAHDDLRAQRRDLALEPLVAGVDLTLRRR